MILELCGIFAVFDKGVVKKLLQKIVLFASVILALAWSIDKAFMEQLRGLNFPSWHVIIRPPFGEDMIYWIAGMYVFAYIVVVMALYFTCNMRSEYMMNDSFSFFHSLSDMMWIFCTFLYAWIALYDLLGVLSREGHIVYTMFRKTAVIVLLFRFFVFVYRLNKSHYYDLFCEGKTRETKALVKKETGI